MRVLSPLAVLACTAALACSAARADQTPSAAGAEVYIIKPANGARVKSPLTVVFGLKGMGIAPAGVKFDNTGHHHLLIDTEQPADPTQPLPATDSIRHFGKGQTEATLDLPPGKHTLQLLFADFTHTPFTPNVVSSRITITVTK
jgi:Domain of unknown function (DUF4399)